MLKKPNYLTVLRGSGGGQICSNQAGSVGQKEEMDEVWSYGFRLEGRRAREKRERGRETERTGEGGGGRTLLSEDE